MSTTLEAESAQRLKVRAEIEKELRKAKANMKGTKADPKAKADG